jgi:hypothetical protein
VKPCEKANERIRKLKKLLVWHTENGKQDIFDLFDKGFNRKELS